MKKKTTKSSGKRSRKRPAIKDLKAKKIGEVKGGMTGLIGMSGTPTSQAKL
jgi:hypothetical protein